MKTRNKIFIVIAAPILISIGYCEYMNTGTAHFRTLIRKPIPASVKDLTFKESGLQNYSCSFYFIASSSDIELIRNSWFPAGSVQFIPETEYRKTFGTIFAALGHPFPQETDISFYSSETKDGWRAMLIQNKSGAVYMTHWE